MPIETRRLFYHEVRSVEEALMYITDCTLATVSSLAMKKSRPKFEYARQKGIAKKGVDCLRSMVDPPFPTRVAEAAEIGVDAWARKYEV